MMEHEIPLGVSQHSVYNKNAWEMPHSWRSHGLRSWFDKLCDSAIPQDLSFLICEIGGLT